MPSAKDAQALPFIDRGLRLDHYRTILPNLSYPSRPNSHILWSWSSAPLVFSNTMRPDVATATSATSVQAPTTVTANICFDTSSVPDVFQGIGVLIWHNLLMIVRKLKLIWQKCFGFRFTSPSATASA